MPKNYEIRKKLLPFERNTALREEVIVTKPNGQLIRGNLTCVKEDGWARVKTCTGFVEWISPECGIEIETKKHS